MSGDDERVREAHRESVDEALKEFEKYLQARGGGDNPAITTGKMIAVQFEHTSSRPDRETRLRRAAASHARCHLQHDPNRGRQSALRAAASSCTDSQKFATAIYRAHFAEKLQALGYEIRVDPRTGAPEIKGFTEEYLQDSSPRRKEVLKEEEKMKERMESEGKTVSDNARLKQAAARNNRRSKNFDHDIMQDTRPRNGRKHDYQAQRHCGPSAGTIAASLVTKRD